MDRKAYMKEYQKRYYEKNREKSIARASEWQRENKDRLKQRRDKPENKAKKAKVDKKYWKNAPEKVRENRRNAIRQWARNNKDKRYSALRKRLDLIKKATPKWANLDAIKAFYKNRPEGMTVDHIIPLQGKTVTGLHVLENLQYLPMSANCKKGNSITY